MKETEALLSRRERALEFVGTGPDSFFMALTLQLSRQGKLPPKLLDAEHEAAAAVDGEGQGGGGGATSASQATEIGMGGSSVRGRTWSTRKMKDAAAAAAARELRLLLLRHMAQQHVYYMQVTGLDAAGLQSRLAALASQRQAVGGPELAAAAALLNVSISCILVSVKGADERVFEPPDLRVDAEGGGEGREVGVKGGAEEGGVCLVTAGRFFWSTVVVEGGRASGGSSDSSGGMSEMHGTSGANTSSSTAAQTADEDERPRRGRPRKSTSTPGQHVAPQAGGERETQTATDSVGAGSVEDAGPVADASSGVDAGSVVASSVEGAETQTASDAQVESLRELPGHTHTDFNEDDITASATESATTEPATESATEAVTRADAQVPIGTDTDSDAEGAGQESREKAADAAKAAISSIGAPREDSGNGANSENSIAAIEEEEEAVTKIAGGSVREWRGYREEAVGEETAREEEAAAGKEEVRQRTGRTPGFESRYSPVFQKCVVDVQAKFAFQGPLKSLEAAFRICNKSIGDRKIGNHSVKRDGTQIAELDYLARQYEALLIRHRAAILSALNKERLS